MKEQQELEELLLEDAKMPALSVSWSQAGTIHAVAVGSIDASENPPRRIDTDTPFQAASLSKPVSAAIVLDLIEHGQLGLNLNTPLYQIAAYGPPEIQQDEGNYSKLTIGMILGQHSGLPNWFWLENKYEFIATPGEHFTYSGEAYQFLKEVIEKKTGKKWEEIAQAFFTKVGMTSSTFKQVPAIGNRAVAVAHEIASADGTLIPDRAELPVDAPELPAGTLRTTAKDYIAFLQYCFKNLKSTLLIGTDVYPFNPIKPLDTSISTDRFQWSLGTGIYTDPTTNKAIAFHWGQNEGGRAFFAMDTETGDCAVCFSNSDNGPAMFQAIAKPIVGDIQPLFQWLAASSFKDEIAPKAPEAIARIIYSMAKPREIDPAVRQKTLAILRERFKPTEVDIDSAIYLSEEDRRNVLMRINLTSTSPSVPKSLILKQVLSQRDDADDKRADGRFACDWAGLEFTSSIQGSGVHNTPLFYGSDVEQRFILIEDLGEQHVSLVDSLLRPDPAKAVSALVRYMKALGSFNATSFGHNDQYMATLKGINKEAPTPEDDLAATSEYLLPKLASSIDLLALSVPETFLAEAKQVLDTMFNPGPFTVLTHGDLAPDNVFDHEGANGLQLIDFENCALRNALLDGTYLRMSIPTGWCAKAIPEEVLSPLEKIYRDELKKTIPEASNDLAYSTAYTHACAYHVLHQMADLEGILDNDVIWGGPMPQFPLWDPATKRSRFLSRLQTFLDVATEHDRLHPDQPPILANLRKMAEDMLIKVKARWPADTKPLDFYPAFKQDSLQLMQTQQSVHKTTHSWTNSTRKPQQLQPQDEVPDMSDIEMTQSAFGQGSNTAKAREKLSSSPVQTKPKPPGI